MEQADLIQEGLIGLCRAAKRFDPSYGVPFHVYARQRVRGSITDVIKTRARKSMIDKDTKQYATVFHFSFLQNNNQEDG